MFLPWSKPDPMLHARLTHPSHTTIMAVIFVVELLRRCLTHCVHRAYAPSCCLTGNIGCILLRICAFPHSMYIHTPAWYTVKRKLVYLLLV